MLERSSRRKFLGRAAGTAAVSLGVVGASMDSNVSSARAAGINELFTYNGTAAAGTLVASVTAESATDHFTNLYLSGETAYAPFGSGFIACQNNGGALSFYTATSEAGPWAALAQLAAQSVPGGTEFLQFGAGVSTGIGVVGPSGDKTGAEDQANIQQALGGFLYVMLLPGTFYLKKPVTMTTGGQVLSGCGPSTVLQEPDPMDGTFSGSALIMPSKSSQRVTNLNFTTISASFIDFANMFMNYFECDHVTGTAGVGASDIFTGANLHRSHFHDLNLTQNNPAKSIWTMTGTSGVSVFTWDNSSLAVSVGASGTRTVPAISIFVAGQVFVDAVRFENLFCDNMPNGTNIDNSQWFFDIACDGSGNIFDRVEFDHVTGNRCLGGLIRVQSSWGISLEHVSVGNMTAFNSIPLNNNIIEIGTNSTSGRASAAVRIINYEREGSTNLVPPPDPPIKVISDIDISPDATQVYIESPNATGTSPQPQINLNCAANVQIMSPSSATNILNPNTTSGQATIVIGNGQIMIGTGVIG